MAHCAATCAGIADNGLVMVDEAVEEILATLHKCNLEEVVAYMARGQRVIFAWLSGLLKSDRRARTRQLVLDFCATLMTHLANLERGPGILATMDVATLAIELLQRDAGGLPPACRATLHALRVFSDRPEQDRAEFVHAGGVAALLRLLGSEDSELAALTVPELTEVVNSTIALVAGRLLSELQDCSVPIIKQLGALIMQYSSAATAGDGGDKAAAAAAHLLCCQCAVGLHELTRYGYTPGSTLGARLAQLLSSGALNFLVNTASTAVIEAEGDVRLGADADGDGISDAATGGSGGGLRLSMEGQLQQLFPQPFIPREKTGLTVIEGISAGEAAEEEGTLLLAAMRLLGNLTSAAEQETQAVVNAGGVALLQAVVQGRAGLRPLTRREAAFALSNICAGTQMQVRSVIFDASRPLAAAAAIALNPTNDKILRRECCYCVVNVFINGAAADWMQLLEESNWVETGSGSRQCAATDVVVTMIGMWPDIVAVCRCALKAVRVLLGLSEPSGAGVVDLESLPARALLASHLPGALNAALRAQPGHGSGKLTGVSAELSTLLTKVGGLSFHGA